MPEHLAGQTTIPTARPPLQLLRSVRKIESDLAWGRRTRQSNLIGMADRVQATDWIAARSTLIRDLKREGGLSDAALEAMGAVPRHEFIPATKRQDSYANHPVPIGLGQTISQPDMVGWLADAVGAAAASVVTVEANHTATRHGEGVECGSTGLFTG